MSRTTLFTTEADLDIHGVYEKARESRQRLDEVYTQLVNTREQLRAAETKLSDRELAVAIQYRADNADMSQAQFDKQVRWAISQDGEYLKFRYEVGRLKTLVDGLEADRSVLKRDIEIAVGRMNSLGGYFFFLASERLTSSFSGE